MAIPVLKKHGAKHERNWTGPLIFSYGFRPFFLFAGLFAVLSMALWLAELQGFDALYTELAPVDWHKHEMLFGYTSAVVAGFLFTAVPNWTGRYPVSGWPLIGMFALWLSGRLGMLLGGGLPYGLIAALDMAFLPVLGAVMGREIIVGNNRKNLKVLAPILILAAANIWFHLDMIMGGLDDAPIRLGFSAILLLLILIGGRITPSFTRNWLARQDPGRLPIPFNQFDGVVVLGSAIGLGLWTFVDTFPTALSALIAALGLAHIIRLWRWVGWRTTGNPLLLVLHIFYSFIPVGFLVLAASLWYDDPALNTAALHVFGIGATGGMTLSVMIRASLGHTGRPLAADRVMIAMLLALVGSIALRLTVLLWPEYDWAITGSALCWITAFGLFSFKVGPWLITRRLTK